MCLEQSRAERCFSVLMLSYLWATTLGTSSTELLELNMSNGQRDLPKLNPNSIALLKFSKGFPISDYKNCSYLWDEELCWYSDTHPRASSILVLPYGRNKTSKVRQDLRLQHQTLKPSRKGKRTEKPGDNSPTYLPCHSKLRYLSARHAFCQPGNLRALFPIVKLGQLQTSKKQKNKD